MKLIIGAIALVFAFPAAAQTAPAAPQHQGHAEHQQSGGHQEHGQHQGQPGQHQPGQHQGHGDGCCADRNNNGRMDCCENMPEGQSCCCEHHGESHGEQEGHQGH